MVSLLAPGEKMAEVLNRTRTEAKAKVSKVSKVWIVSPINNETDRSCHTFSRTQNSWLVAIVGC